RCVRIQASQAPQMRGNGMRAVGRFSPIQTASQSAGSTKAFARRAPRRCAPGPGPGAGGLGGGSFARRGPYDAGEHRSSIAVQDLLARFLADLRFGERLPGPVAAELSTVSAADDALGAVEAHGRLDRARAERVAIHVHLRSADARRRQLLLRRVEQAAVVHALDLVGKVSAQIVDLDHRVWVVREVVGPRPAVGGGALGVWGGLAAAGAGGRAGGGPGGGGGGGRRGRMPLAW